MLTFQVSKSKNTKPQNPNNLKPNNYNEKQSKNYTNFKNVKSK